VETLVDKTRLSFLPPLHSPQWLIQDKGGLALDNGGGAGAAKGNQTSPVKTPSQKTPHKLGANQKETAARTRPHDSNFKQSRDVREDRGARQAKTNRAPRTLRS